MSGGIRINKDDCTVLHEYMEDAKMSKRLSPPDAETALRIYYDHPLEIGSEEIRELFGVKAGSTIARIKKEVRNAQAEEKTLTWNPANVDTDTAYRIWGLNVEKLERSLKRKKAMGFCLESTSNTK